MAATAYGRVPPIVVASKKEHKSTLLMLHGLGDTGDGWEDIAYMLGDELPNTKFIFPTAPVATRAPARGPAACAALRPITVNGGMQCTGWFDIASLDRLTAEQDAEGLHASKAYVEEILRQEAAAGVPSPSVVVGGFSQGGALALLMLRSELQLAGVMALSAYLPLHHEEPLVSAANAATPVLMCHGDCDPVVNYAFGKRSYEELKQAGARAEFKAYRFMEHEARPDELQDVRAFLKGLLAPAPAAG
eukprot:scaffold17.g559.t1